MATQSSWHGRFEKAARAMLRAMLICTVMLSVRATADEAPITDQKLHRSTPALTVSDVASADRDDKRVAEIHEILEDFERLTFGSKFRFGPDRERSEYLVKWNREINFGIWQSQIDETGIRYKNITDFMKLSETELSIKWNILEKISAYVDVAVYFISSSDEFIDLYEKLEDRVRGGVSQDVIRLKNMMKDAINNNIQRVNNGSLCFISLQKNRYLGFVRAYIMIMDYGKRRRECVFQNFFRVSGFMGNNAGSVHSILSDIRKIDVFTETDKIAARVLYDERMKIGMSRAESMRTAKAIISEIFAQRGR